MDKNQDIVIGNIILRAPKSIEEMMEYTYAFYGPNHKELADKCIREKLKINSPITKEFLKKGNADKENKKQKSSILGELNSNDLNKSVKPENTNQGITDIAKHENEKQADIFPNMPKRRNDWFDAIYAMTEIYHEKHGEIPSIGQAWSILWNDPPEGHKIATKTVLHINYLVMGGNDLSENSFKKRWRNYTTSPNKGE
jgi:hypothetical protein